MPRDTDSVSSASGQSKRPPLFRKESDTQGDLHLRHKQGQKQHHVGRLHARVPSAKGLHKAGHNHSHTHLHTRRIASPPDQAHQPPSSHRRSTSEVKLQRELSATSLAKNQAESSLKRNRSYGDVHRRSKSSDKLKRNSGGAAAQQRPKSSSKSQVHFDLGSDGPDEEGDWVDASGSNSPHMSRKGSINGSAQSSVRQAQSNENSRPQTPADLRRPEASTPDRERTHHQQYLTSRLLQRTPSHGAPPKMAADVAQINPSMSSPDDDAGPGTSLSFADSNKEGLTSRFVDAPGSGVTSEGSFYHPPGKAAAMMDDSPHRPTSATNLSRPNEEPDHARLVNDTDDSALVPKTARRRAAPPAETSRIQQKLNLQRASSAIEPGPSGPVSSGVATPLIGVSGPGFDGGTSRDPRVGKLLDRTGMEYLVVRRHQNPVARSLNRLRRLPDEGRMRRIPRVNTGSTNSKRSVDLRHTLAGNAASASRPVTPRHDGDPGFDADEESRLSERLSGSSLVGSSDDDGTAALLRNLWDKSMDLSGSGD